MSAFPTAMADAAFIGPLGAAVLALEDQVETCREALLIETLVFFGNAVGRTAYFQVSRSRHYANEYVVLPATPAARARAPSATSPSISCRSRTPHGPRME